LSILVSVMGLTKGGTYMEQYVRGIQSPVLVSGKNISSGGWLVKKGLWGEDVKIWTPETVSSLSWNANVSLATNKSLVWYAIWFATDTAEAPISLDLGGMGKGYAWVNGHNIGRYYDVLGNASCTPFNYTGRSLQSFAADDDFETMRNARNARNAKSVDSVLTSWWLPNWRADCQMLTQQFYHVPAAWITPGGKTLVVVLEEVGGDPTTIQLIKRTGGPLCVQGPEHPAVPYTQTLTCSPGTYIKSVDFASFGTPKGQCGSFSLGACHSNTTASVVEKLCIGASYCVLPLSSLVFGDACPQTAKSLAVQVTCA